jgi:ribulose 1,5-bisphosphate synthetase/thiazole synthase
LDVAEVGVSVMVVEASAVLAGGFEVGGVVAEVLVAVGEEAAAQTASLEGQKHRIHPNLLICAL